MNTVYEPKTYFLNADVNDPVCELYEICWALLQAEQQILHTEEK